MLSRSAIIIIIATFALLVLLQLNIHPGSAPMQNDTVAIEVINRIHVAESSFHSATGRYGTLDELGPVGAGLIPKELASGSMSGFRFEIKAEPNEYIITAVPIQPFVTGYRTFSSDRSRVITYEFAKGGKR
jgi:hypothetical protein